MATVTVFQEEEFTTENPRPSSDWLSSFEDLNFIDDILPEKEKLEQFFITL